MRLMVYLFATAYFVAVFASVSDAGSNSANPDPVAARLDDAKTVNAKAHQQAAEMLRSAMEAAIKSATAAKQPDVAAQLKSQEQAFIATGQLPASTAVKQAAESYHEAIDLADANLDRAFSRAVRHYASQGDGDRALAVEQEKSRLNQQRLAATAAPTTPNAGNPTAIAQTLLQAKARYRTDVNDATQKLIAKLDARLNTAMNAGDLPAAQGLKAMKESLQSNGQIPEHPTDSVVVTAVADYRHAIQSANVQIARGYSQAVHDLTRARQLDQAEVVQRDYVTCELSGIDLNAVPDSGATPGDTTYVLGRNLPELLTTTDHWEMHPRGGIFLAKHTFIRSKNGNFLDRDFTCDLWFTTETTGTNMFIGLGDGRGRPEDDVPTNSLALCITSPDLNEGATGFLRPDGQIDTIGHLTSAGDYVARLEKAGNVLTMSIGDEDADGTFNPRFSTSISDTTVIAPFMTTHNVHIFFGGGRFWKLRYINGKPPAVIPDVVVRSLIRD